DIIAKYQGLARNAEYLDLPHWRSRASGVRIVSNRPDRHSNATDLSAVKIEYGSVAQVVGDYKREVVREKVPVEMSTEIIGGWTAGERGVDGGVGSGTCGVTK